jgi:hypothetical protein
VNVIHELAIHRELPESDHLVDIQLNHFDGVHRKVVSFEELSLHRDGGNVHASAVSGTGEHLTDWAGCGADTAFREVQGPSSIFTIAHVHH